MRCLARAEITLWNLEEGNRRFLIPFLIFVFNLRMIFLQGWVGLQNPGSWSACPTLEAGAHLILTPRIFSFLCSDRVAEKSPFMVLTCVNSTFVIPCNGRHSHHNDDQILTITRGSV